MLWKSSSSEKVAAIEGSISWKSSSHSKKADIQKKYVMRNIVFVKNLLFSKYGFSEKINAV